MITVGIGELFSSFHLLQDSRTIEVDGDCGVISFCAIAAAIYFFIRTLFLGTDLPGFPSLIVSVMFFEVLTRLL